MKALVTLASAPAGLFVVRRLHALGYQVTVVDSHTRSYASYSNRVSKRIVAPSLRYDPHGFAKAVIGELQQEQYDLYFPTMECGFLMSYYRDTIEKYTKWSLCPMQTSRMHIIRVLCEAMRSRPMSECP